MGITLTLSDIYSRGPCGRESGAQHGWARLLRYLGLPYDRPDMGLVLGIEDVLMANGHVDAQWCLGAVRDSRAGMTLAIPAVMRAAPISGDDRVVSCAAWVLQWCRGHTTTTGKEAVRRIAMAAARDAKSAAIASRDAIPAQDAARAVLAAVDGLAYQAAALAEDALTAFGERNAERKRQAEEWARLSPARHRAQIMASVY